MTRTFLAAFAFAALFAAAQNRAPRYISVAHAAETSGHADAVAAFAPASFAPMAYFDQKCARCHGPQGSFYGKDFGRDLDDAKLHATVNMMASGPAQAPISAPQLEIEVAYHRALIAKQPFVVVTDVTRDEKSLTLHGEATPGSALQIVAGKTKADAKLEKFAWTATLPANVDLNSATLTAKVGEAQTILKLSKSAWSHAKADAKP